MEREAILDLAQEHLMLNNRSNWVGGDNEVVDFAKALLAKLDAPAPPDGIWMKRVGDSFTFTGAALEPGKQYTVTVSPHEAAELEAEPVPAPPEVATNGWRYLPGLGHYPIEMLDAMLAKREVAIDKWLKENPDELAKLTAASPAVPVAAGLPAMTKLDEDEQNALLCKIEDYMNMTDKLGTQMHPDCTKAENDIYALVDEFLAKRAAAPVLPVEQPSQPAVRTAGCTLCGVCAATGERVTASPIAEQAPSPDLKWLAAIQALCVTIDQECTRKQGLLSEWDQGWFLGQLHVFDLYTATPKDAIEQAREYMRKVFIEADKGRALQSGQPQDQSGCDSALRAEPAGQHNATASDAADFLDKKADDYANEYGAVDPDTGTLEFKNIHGEEYYNCLRELADDIRALPATAAPVPHMGGNTKPESSPIAEPDTATQAAKPTERDTERLEFMMGREAWIAWSKDGESCRLFHRNEDDGEPMPMLGWGARHWSHDPREAIDAAIESHLKGE